MTLLKKTKKYLTNIFVPFACQLLILTNQTKSAGNAIKYFARIVCKANSKNSDRVADLNRAINSMLIHMCKIKFKSD